MTRIVVIRHAVDELAGGGAQQLLRVVDEASVKVVVKSPYADG